MPKQEIHMQYPNKIDSGSFKMQGKPRVRERERQELKQQTTKFKPKTVEL